MLVVGVADVAAAAAAAAAADAAVVVAVGYVDDCHGDDDSAGD